MDNVEWAFGYGSRFGLVRGDYDTQARRLKDSAHAYREIIRANGLPPSPPRCQGDWGDIRHGPPEIVLARQTPLLASVDHYGRP
jgi:hypothetical protein